MNNYKNAVEAISKIEDLGSVYFIKDNSSDSVKIGMSSKPDPTDRFESFMTYSPRGGVLIGYIKTENPNKLEKEIHKKYIDRKINREWFNLTIKESLSEIKSHGNYISNIEESLEKSIVEFECLLEHINNITDEKEVVQLFELILSKVTIGTIQQIADIDSKSYNGIKNSNCYRKVDIGGKKLVVKGVRNSNLPF